VREVSGTFLPGLDLDLVIIPTVMSQHWPRSISAFDCTMWS